MDVPQVPPNLLNIYLKHEVTGIQYQDAGEFQAEMKASSLTVKECSWTTEECHLVEEQGVAVEMDTFCLPNIFRSRKVKPRRKTPVTQTYQVYYTARELFLEVLDREAIWELIRRAPGVKAGEQRLSHGREQSSVLSEEYAEGLMWFSIVLQSGLCVGENCRFSPEPTQKLDKLQGLLKRNSIQNKILSLTGLEDGNKLEALSAFCSHIFKRYQVLHSPGPNLTVKKYNLYHQQGQCSLQLALLSDTRSGFVCNMFLYCQQQLQKQSRKPVVEQVVRQLLGPFCSQKWVVHIDSSAWMDGRLKSIFSGGDMNVHFVPVTQKEMRNPTSSESLPISPQRLSSEDTFSAHLQGWTGPSLVPHSDLTGSSVDIFLPGLWVALHTVCINTYVLHTLQRLQLSGRHIQLTEFSRALASQLTADHSISVPVLPRLNSCSYQESTHPCKERMSSNSVATAKENPSLLLRFQKSWRRPGVCGLENSGNSCYLNAVLQCLCTTVPLVEQLLHQDMRKELAKSQCRVSEVFVDLLEKMWLGSGSSCSPLKVRSALRSVFPQFDNDSQQDAQEMLLLLVNTLHDDFNKVAQRQMHSSLQQLRRGCSSDSNIVTRLFEGQLSYMCICMHCHNQAHNTQTFTVLSVPVPKDSIKCSIQDCLSLFFKQTVLTGGEQAMCSVCRLKRETAVVTCVDRTPEILVLHLKRFGSKGKNQVKLRTNVLFFTKLDLSQFLSGLNHSGHLNMGHYTAVCYNSPAQTWHCFDDAAVSEVQEDRLQSPNAYLLFYSHKPFHRPRISGL
ncbi:hypothetical protein OJAV_G00020770 [Oryzias javanicus]|uniref:ubiquitinyl hydrolase 1 n=1 Tax=Oryzias javanicus TaxID=123683 RepID=A0A437DHS1_ORYJA|nr:hypothetical protein OJAV_G00020770 [Oryzias javanicus]